MRILLKNVKKECGAVEIVEAAIVFPIVIFVVILIIFYGNMVYQQSKMEAIAVRGAEYMAGIYTNPLLIYDSIPTDTTEIDVKPYRYLLGDAEAEENTKAFIETLMFDTGTGFFSGMNMSGTVKTCEIKNYVVYQTCWVEIEYSINLLPMKLFDSPTLFKCTTATITSATDPAEIIRNVDMVLDYSEEFGLTEKIKSAVSAFTGK